jgi:hypothetical protein
VLSVIQKFETLNFWGLIDVAVEWVRVGGRKNLYEIFLKFRKKSKIVIDTFLIIFNKSILIFCLSIFCSVAISRPVPISFLLLLLTTILPLASSSQLHPLVNFMRLFYITMCSIFISKAIPEEQIKK